LVSHRSPENSLRVHLYETHEGVNEHNQYQRFLTLNRTGLIQKMDRTAVLKSYKYEVKTVRVPKVYGEPLLLMIQERSGAHFSSGGSSFNIWIRTDTYLDRCWATDRFNGYYNVTCPTFTTCANVTIELAYVTFDAYKDIFKLHPILKPLADIAVCLDNNLKDVTQRLKLKPRKLPFCVQGKLTMKEQMKAFKWVVSEGRLHIGTSDCIVPVIDKKRVCDCAKQFNSFTGVGSSHMRNNIDWIMEACGYSFQGLSTKHGTVHWKNLVYVKSRYVTDMMSSLHHMGKSSPASSDKNDVIMMQLSCWDFVGRGQHQLMKKLPGLLTYLKKLSVEQRYSTSKLILLNGQPYPDLATTKDSKKPTKVYRRGYANNFIAQVFNYQLRQHLEGTNIDIVDMFSLLYPRRNEAVCVLHYMCRIQQGPLIGHLGRTMMQYVIGDTCAQINN
jgi:hypothetical protein